MKTELPASLLQKARELEDYYGRCFPAAAPLARPSFLCTAETTMQRLTDGSRFVITGDIPAMWLRDGASQIANYIPLAAEDPAVRETLAGVIETMAGDVCADPYANAFNAEANGHGFHDVYPQSPRVWERKYEVDSLCAPICAGWSFWKAAHCTDVFTDAYREMLQKIAEIFTLEQDHAHSDYRFERRNCVPQDTLPNGGRGTPVGPTGMVWSGFRPSDDACTYGYLIPANMMAAVAMERAAEISREIYHDAVLAEVCGRLRRDILNGLNRYGVVEHPKYGKIYAYETDGLGHYNLMDDANSPSLLSAPYLGFCAEDDELYRNTRRFVLSQENPYYTSGRFARGVGSPHTPKGYVWPIALTMQALTTKDRDERLSCLSMLCATHAGTNHMHESFDPSDPQRFTRSWFAWADTLFAGLLLRLMDERFFG